MFEVPAPTVVRRLDSESRNRIDVASNSNYAFIDKLSAAFSLCNGEPRFHDPNCATLLHDDCESYPICFIIVRENNAHYDRLLYSMGTEGLHGMSAFVGSEPYVARTIALMSMGIFAVCRAHKMGMPKSLIRSPCAQDKEMPAMAAVKLVPHLVYAAGVEKICYLLKIRHQIRSHYAICVDELPAASAACHVLLKGKSGLSCVARTYGVSMDYFSPQYVS